MKKQPALEIRRILTAYQKGSSAQEVAKEYNTSLHRVYRLLRQHNLQRRSSSESNAIQFQRKKPSFRLVKPLNQKGKELKIAALMLYWGEGSQWSGETIVDFANSNSSMVRVFLKFLREVCGVDEKRLRGYLYCYSNQNPKKLISYWSSLTKIPSKQFTKPYIRKDYHPTKENKMQYGVVHIRYYDKKLLLLIKQWINDFVDAEHG